MMANSRFVIVIFSLFCSVMVAQYGGNIEKRVYTTKSIEDQQAPEIDGILDDKSWDTVEWTGDFLEREPDENTAPTEQTKFKIIYVRSICI